MKKLFGVLNVLIKPFLILFSAKLVLALIKVSMKYEIYSLKFQNDIREASLNRCYAILFLLILNSFILAYNSNDRAGKEKFLEYARKTNKISCLKFVTTTPFFYAEAFLLVVISAVFPTNFFYDFVPKAFFDGVELSAEDTKLYTLIIVFAALILVDFLAHLVVAKEWLKGINGVIEDVEKGAPSYSFETVKRVFRIALLYVVASVIIVMFWPIFDSFNVVSGGKLVFLIIFWGTFSLLLVFSFFSLRALIKRFFFVERLKKYCKANSVPLSEIVKPYSSIFVSHKGANFTVEKNGKKYDCKFMSSLFPGSPIIFSDKGVGIKHTRIHLFHIELFSKMKDFNYEFESENRKLLIIVPTPKKILSQIRGSKLGEADTGEKLGEYTIYNSSGFLNSLDRNLL